MSLKPATTRAPGSVLKQQTMVQLRVAQMFSQRRRVYSLTRTSHWGTHDTCSSLQERTCQGRSKRYPSFSTSSRNKPRLALCLRTSASEARLQALLGRKLLFAWIAPIGRKDSLEVQGRPSERVVSWEFALAQLGCGSLKAAQAVCRTV